MKLPKELINKIEDASFYVEFEKFSSAGMENIIENSSNENEAGFLRQKLLDLAFKINPATV